MKRYCPSCRHHWAWKLNDNRFKCRRCGHRYTFHNAWNVCRLPNQTKLKLLECFVLGVPAYRLRFRGRTSQPTIKRFFRTIRAVLAVYEQCREPFNGAVECDETMFGGKRKGKRGWGAAGKIIVLGILQRNGKVKVFPVKGRETERLLPLVRQSTRPGSLYYTDDWRAYGSLSVRGNHVVIRQRERKT